MDRTRGASGRTLDDLFTLTQGVRDDLSTVLQKLDGMENRLSDVEKDINEIKDRQVDLEATKCSKDELEETTAKLKAEIREERERILRKNNLIVFGIPETMEGNDQLDELLQIICPQDVHIENERVGKMEKAGKRPLRLYLTNPAIKRQMLKNCSKLKGNDRMKHISVSHDMTREQVQERASTPRQTRAATRRKAAGVDSNPGPVSKRGRFDNQNQGSGQTQQPMNTD